ncbi:hypothetical protein IEQ44_08260 [Nocardioides sp. Y6]|uniref:Alpha/beta hydrolase domain-containing protein n=1 Tax=Nocardioides malaquae TaxID=2773426 RepID=A0ABR9RSV3_9ACTN|nr:alpha/beta hydrolase domain-containing protein [Nocardioides malaquae]MBE7324644.1 hypothetical protein [Nocardioides malaquae]
MSVRTRLLATTLTLAAALVAAPAALVPGAQALPDSPSGRSVADTDGLVRAPEGRPQASIGDLTAPAGYVESEFFLSGEADSYSEVGEWGPDGKWEAEVDRADVPFTTRLIVNRPEDPRRFNGTVWVEWLNVSTGADVAPSFVQARDRILASGAAWVGVSAQRAGVEAAKRNDPRYEPLEITSDAFSYDIYAQAGRAVRKQAAEMLDGLRPRKVIASGESQSAFRLTTYVNALHRADRVFDGFLIHSRYAPSAPLAEDGFFGDYSPTIRTDVGVPVFQLQTEGDLGNWESVRQPNRGKVHTWEVAGSAHADVHTVESTLGKETTPEGVAWLMGCDKPVNDFPFRHAANAAYAAMDRWVTFGIRPPAAKPIEIVDNVIQRDRDGNAKGGVRLPDLDVPVATHSGLGNSSTEAGNFICGLFGTTKRFTTERLSELYPTRHSYVTAYTVRTMLAAARGHMTWSDAHAAIAAVRKAPLPR